MAFYLLGARCAGIGWALLAPARMALLGRLAGEGHVLERIRQGLAYALGSPLLTAVLLCGLSRLRGYR